MSNRNEIRIGDVLFNTMSGDMHGADGARIELRNKSTEVLACLAAHPGEIVGKETIMDAVWPDVTVTDESLTQCISDIRKAIGDSEQVLLRTHVGKGYSLTVQQEMRGGHIWQVLAVAVFILIAFSGVAMLWMAGALSKADATPRIAILAFDDLSSGDDKGWLSDGIAEGVITELARYPEFLVIARNSSFSVRDKDLSIAEIAELLDADYIVEGSKQKSGNRLRVTAQLINGHDGTHLWAEEYDADIGDLFDIQSQIVRSIATNIGHELTWNAPPSGGRDRVSALHFFLLGNTEFRKLSRDSSVAARDHYLRAIDADPNAAYGHVGMAWIYWRDMRNNWINPEMPRAEKLRRGVEHAETALRLDPDYYAAHIVRADLHANAGEHEEALIRFKAAQALNPSSGVALAASSEPLVFLDRAEEAIAIMEQALRTDPINPRWYYWNLGWAQWAAGHCVDGIASMKMMPHIPADALRTLAVLYACNGETDKAKETIALFLGTEPDYTVTTYADRFGETWRNSETFHRWLDDLRTAGLPEG